MKSHYEIATRSVFIRYPANNDITKEFSLMADARMIWGGDQTVNNIRFLKTGPKCIDITFSDRYSFSIVDGSTILNASGSRIARLAEDFYNDTYLMDQNACSSPMLICWINDSENARKLFWNAVYKVAKRKYYLQDTVCVDKYTKSCKDAIDKHGNISKITRETNLLYRVEIKKLIGGLEVYRAKGGYFYEYSMKSIDDIIPTVTEKFQTITYFGVNPEDIRDTIIKNKLRGIDRITPIGKAMDIGVIWDGYDLIRMLSRLVNVE